MRWLWLIFFSLAAKGQVIVFDRTLSQPVYINDPGPSGISQLVDALESNGMGCTNAQHYSLGWTDNYSNFLLVLTPTIHRSYSANEIQNFKLLLEMGINILIVAEHDNYYYNADNLNQICEPYGIKINNASVKKDKTLQGAWPVGKSDKYGLNNIRFYLPASLTCAPNAEKIAVIDTTVVCAKVKAEKGAITVLADYEMLWNMTATEGINYGDNKRFLTHLFTLPPMPDSIHYRREEEQIPYLKLLTDSANPRKFLIAENIQDPAKEIGKNDVVFFIKPTTYLNWPDSIFKRIKKAVIIGAEYSNYFTLLKNNNGQNVLDLVGYKEQPLPINSIAKHFGLRFSESVLSMGGVNNIVLKSSPEMCIPFERPSEQEVEGASIISQLNPKEKFVIKYVTKGNYKELLYYAPLEFNEALGNDSIIPLPTGPVITNSPLLIYNNRVMAISSNYLWDELLDGYYCGEVRNIFVDWLKLK